MISYPEKIASHIIFYAIFLLTFINLGFVFGFAINTWNLPITYVLYLSGIVFIKVKKHQKFTIGEMLAVFIIPALAFFSVWVFGHTFDNSYDGQGYHQSAVISLANGWNPWGDSVLLEKFFTTEPFIVGYPKSLWIIQSSIYKLFPDHINGATVTNLIASVIALIFMYGLLVRLKISKVWATTISIFAVLQPILIQQFFTFMAEGFSYEVMLIVIGSLGMFIIDHDKKWSFIVFCSLILLAGTKYSNLFILGVLGLIYAVYLFKIYNRTDLIKTIILFFIVGSIILWVPYGNNLIKHGSPIYPSNLKWASDDVKYQNTPINLKGFNRFFLLFYGIYSQVQHPSSPNSTDNIAVLKIPFTITLEEINITNDYQGRVASQGVLFGGLFTLSFVLYVLSLWFSKNNSEHKIFIVIFFILVATIITALVNPVPNKLRYTPIFYLIPIYMLVAFILMFNGKEKLWMRIGLIFFVLLIAGNILLKLIPSMSARINEVNLMKSELNTMGNSGITYQVNATAFYSNYIRLQEYGVKFIETKNLSCKNQRPLEFSYTTFYCF